MKIRRLLPIGAIVLVALIIGPSVSAAGDETASDFTLETLRGEYFTLSDALAKGPVILDFWATWCGPCRKALPALQALATNHKEDVTVLTVSIDDPRSRSKIGPTMRALGVKLPVLLDSDKTVAALYRVNSVPSTFLIASGGDIVSMHSGYQDGDMARLAAKLDDLLSKGTTK